MINVKDLTEEQLNALNAMAYFNCGYIDCDDCPLNREDDCGSVLAFKYLDMVSEEL